MLRADVLFVGFLCFASPDFSRVSSLFAKKLAVFAKSLRSSTACSTLLELADFSTISMRRLISSRSSITQGPLGAVYGLQNTDEQGSVREQFVLDAVQTKGAKSRTVWINTKLRRQLELYRSSLLFKDAKRALFASQKGSAFSANTMTQLFLNIYHAAGF